MKTYPVVIIAFEEFDNLGVGYLASVLMKEGYEPHIIDFRSKRKSILHTIKKLGPQIIGFSVIFQFYIYEFQRLISYLRKSGVDCHFCAGGQYASLRYRDLFEFIPSLDSIVRFEGEYTFLELVKCIYAGTEWKKIKGIVFKENENIIVNQIRPPEMDLDKFPYPLRSPLERYALGKKFATLMAGRGCVHNCSFCNNTEYIRQSSVSIKRVRNPEKVVEEMDFLYHENDCSVFLFEDDDFPLKTGDGNLWIEKFCKELRVRKLSDKIMWKINCRSDDVGKDSFSLMKDHGLYLVFLGIDDGTDSGLRRLNKHMTVKESLRGINVLKNLEIGFDYGFMLIQPASTFSSINENIAFLKSFLSDGYTPVIFLKLIPFFETKTERVLIKEGRLKGKPGFTDYDLCDSSLDHYYAFLRNSFTEWIDHTEGLVNVLKWGRNYIHVFSRYFELTSKAELVSARIRKITAESNLFILEKMKDLLYLFASGNYPHQKADFLDSYRKNIMVVHDLYKRQAVEAINELCRIAEYQKISQVVKL